MNFRHYYKSGDLIKYYDFSSKSKEDHKPRPALVLGFNKKNNSCFAMRITSKNGKTEQANYRLLKDEVRVPNGLAYNDKTLYGVIKTNNIIEVKRDRIVSTSDAFPLDTKLKVLNVYEQYKYEDWYKIYLKNTKLNYQLIMNKYKENLVAEKLGFFVDQNGESIYEFIRDHYVKISEIQPLGRMGKSNVYAVKLKNENLMYEGNIATKKPLKKILKDWSNEKKVSSWLREDVKFHLLMNNINFKLQVEPFARTDKYKTFNSFKKVHLRKFEQDRFR